MEYALGEGASWRSALQAWLEGRLGHSVFNPNEESERFFASRYPGIDVRKLKSENIRDYTEILRLLVEIDTREIAERSDYVLCLWDDGAVKGAGTKGELTIASFFKKPVYLVTSHPHQEIPGWVLGCTTRIFRDFDALKAFLVQEHPPTP